MTEKDLKMLENVLQPRTYYVNEKNYDVLVKRLGYVPTNLIINPYLDDDTALVIKDTKPF